MELREKNMRSALILLILLSGFCVIAEGKAESNSELLGGNWSNKSSDSMNWSDAKAYCADLDEDGYSDWRLPTISELRTLIKNCLATETGRACKVTNDCLSWDKCRGDACGGCSNKSDDRYSKLGDTEWFWSSSERSDYAGYAWGVAFVYGGVSHGSKLNVYNVRCVRGGNIGGGKEQNGKALISQEKKVEKNDTSLKTSGGAWSKKAPNKMNWSDAKKYCASLDEDGSSDWRLPTISELRTLIQNYPATETGGACRVTDECLSWKECRTSACDGYFPSSDGKYSKLGDTGWFWSSSEPSDGANGAWVVHFGSGNVDVANTVYTALNVRCVHGGNIDGGKEQNGWDLISQENKVEKNDTSFKTSGLTWSKKSSNEMEWNDAKKYCENLVEDGYSDWRLPTISELRTLIKNCTATETGGACKVTNECLSYEKCRDDVCNGCSVSSDGRYSKLGDTGWFWSSSEQSDNADFVWIVNFYYGYVEVSLKINHTNVRCIRSENIGGGKEQNGKDIISQEKKVEKAAASLKPSGGNWSKKAPKAMDWNYAKKYCENLKEGGYSDWRLPTISELRTLIKNCPATETGGACKVTNDCLSWKDCRTSVCDGCSGASDGRYSKLGDTEWFWSSSERSGYANLAWNVLFYHGGVGNIFKNSNFTVRCVR